MKLKFLFIILMVVTLMGCSQQVPKADSKEEVQEKVNLYLTAVEKKDVDGLVTYADDIRFGSKAEQKKVYREINQKIENTSIKKLRQINNEEYEVTITCVVDGKADEYTFPVKYQQGDWRIIVGQERR